MVDRMPQPALVFLVTDKRPHFIDFCLVNSLNFNDHVVWIQTLQEFRIDEFEVSFFFSM
jgi:hypothetical protein